MLHNDLYSYLIGTPDIVALFPGGIHHMTLPQDVDEWPAVTFQGITRIEIGNDMESPNDDKVDQASYQFDVIADASGPCIDAADAFLRIFRNFRGTMQTTRVQWVQMQNVNHFEERRGDKLRRRVSMDFSITFDTE